MKKLSNMQTLKNLVNADVLECIKCRIYGVQAYNISANEYEVIVKFAKQGGRYYFIDRDGNRYLASRYDRAEDVAADILENIECTALVVNALVDEIQAKGKVSVDYEFLDLFLNECDRREIEAESVENNYLDNGEMFTVYRLNDEQGAENDAQSEETAAYEQDSDSEEQQTESEATATTCEPSAFSSILAKAEPAAAKSKSFFSILAKMEWYYFILFGPSLVMLGVVVNCVYLLASGACPDMGRAVDGIVLFTILAFAFAFGGFVMASDEWDEAKKEILIYNK